jgi:hypothetical protein
LIRGVGGSLGKLDEAGAGFVGGGVINSTSGKYGLGYVELGEIPGVADAGVVGFGNGTGAGAGGYVEGSYSVPKWEEAATSI